MRLPPIFQSKPFLIVVGLIWAIAVASGAGWLMSYQMTPGKTAATTPAWPGAGDVKLAADRFTLLMFVHPDCPCSRASLGELQELMADCGDRVAARVLFFGPVNQPAAWSHTDLWNTANAIPTVEARIDTGGALAQRFGVRTSGQVLIYNPQGRLLFNGGITDGRGHFGDNAGLDAATEILRGTTPAPSGVVTANVYGCEISWPSAKDKP